MNEDEYYIKVVVDGVVVPDSSLCGGYTRGADCTYKVTSFIVIVVGDKKALGNMQTTT